MAIEFTNWKALKDVECPKCGCRLIKNEIGYGCCSCSFKIREAKFNEIINSMMSVKAWASQRDEVEDNLRGLSDL